MKQMRSEVNILRGIAFCLVLLGHSFPDSAYGFINPYTEFAHAYIYSFHMPLFFIISGFCMEPMLLSQEIKIKDEIRKRCKRLLIPYLFYSYIAIIPKVIFNKYMYIKFEPKIIWETLIGNSASGTLWYLWNLFIINVFFICLSRLVSRKWLWLLISIVSYISYLIFPGVYFNRLLKYPIFYVLGVYVAAYFPMIKKQIRKRGMAMLLLMLIDAVIVTMIGNDIRVELLTALLGSTSMLYLAIWIDECSNKIKSFLTLSSQYSYGIYLMNPYIQVAIRVFLYRKLGMPYLLCMGLMLVLGYLVPFMIIKYIVEPNKYLSGILIGKW